MWQSKFGLIAARLIVAASSAIWPLPVAAVDGALRFTGINIAGAEFGSAVPGKAGTDYVYPTNATIDYFAARGVNLIRIPFRWERLQHPLSTELDADELNRIDAVVRYATSKRMRVLLDVHNYAAYSRQAIGTPAVPVTALADLWGRLAEHYKGNDGVIFGLMNEPKGLPTETWLEAANNAIAEIRRRGARNLILVPGNGWTGAHSWRARSYGTPNSEVMSGIVDPARNFAYEAHQYLDGNFSGTHPNCKSERVGVTALTGFTDWLRRKHARGFLGEFGGGSDAICLAALDAMLGFMEENRDVWLGWAYWAAGPWPASYFTSIQPQDGVDRPQMKALLKHIARSRSDQPSQ